MVKMVAVISDLHFEEEASDIIHAPDPDQKISLPRNIPGVVFERLIDDLMEATVKYGADQLELVLAGDVFDLHRTQLWFNGALRPYVDSSKVDKTLESKLLTILDAIAAEERVIHSLNAFRRLTRDRYPAEPGDERDVPCKVTLTYLPGNHDRLINATPVLRARARELLGLPPSAEPFEHSVTRGAPDDPPVLIRHGHEYDRHNFPLDLRAGPIPPATPDFAAAYDRATFGDFLTVHVGSGLAYRFRAHHGDANLLTSPVLRETYRRILRFDDVRPQSAVLDYLLATTPPEPAAGATTTISTEEWRGKVWAAIEPVLRAQLDEVIGLDDFERLAKGVVPGWILALLKLRPWRFGLPLPLLRAGLAASKWLAPLLPSSAYRPEEYAARETALTQGGVAFVAAGHTHAPQTAALGRTSNRDGYFVDTGTWRNALLATGDNKAFGRLHAKTFVLFTGPGTLPDRTATERGLDFLSGFDRTWP